MNGRERHERDSWKLYIDAMNHVESTTYLLSQREVSVLIAAALLELGDAGLLVLGFLVVAALFFDQAVEDRGCDCDLGGWRHRGELW